MSKISLYRKYRPHTFKNLVGQDHIRTTIQNALQKDMVTHAYIFTGPRGTGKTSLARLIAKALNCTNPDKDMEPCNECEICTDINTGRLIDLIEIDAASNRGIDEIRELRDKINFAPTRAKNKVYIIDEVHMLTKEAFNALLKTLEEPPKNVYFILATTEIHKVPDTIISRCQRFDFKRIDITSLGERLKYIAEQEKIKAEEEALSIIAGYSQGGLRDAIGLFEQMIFDNEVTLERVKQNLGSPESASVENLYNFLKQKNRIEALELINSVHSGGYDLTQFTKELIAFMREKLLINVKESNNSEINEICKMISAFQEAYTNIKNSVIPELPLEMAVIKICMEESSDTLEKVCERKEQVKNSPAPIIARIENTAPNNNNIALSFEFVKKNWARIVENIKTPSIRRSFNEGNLSKVDGDTVVIGFGSNFHLEKVNNVTAKSEIFSAFEKIFNKKIELQFVLQEVNLKPDFIDKEREHREIVETPKENLKESPNLIQDALDVFGGEISN